MPKARTLALLLLSFSALAVLLTRNSLGPLQEAVRARLSLTDNQISLIQGPALAIPPLVLGSLLGLLIDRHSRFRLICIFCSLSVIGGVMTALCGSLPSLLISRAIVSIPAYAVPITAFSLIGDLYPPDQRGRAITVVAIAEVIGLSAAFELGGMLLGTATSNAGWRLAALCLTLPGAIAVFPTLGLTDPPRTNVQIEKPSLRQSCCELWRYRGLVVPLVSGAALVGVADGAALIWAAPALMRRFSIPASDAATIVAATTLIAGLLGPLIGGAITDARQCKGGTGAVLRAIGWLTALSAVSGLFGLAPGPKSAGIPLTLFLTLGAAISVSITTTITVALPNELRGLSLSFLGQLSLAFGLGFAPLTVSILSGRLGGPAALDRALSIVCTATSAFGALLFFLSGSWTTASNALGQAANP